jgi:hypothetical protein
VGPRRTFTPLPGLDPVTDAGPAYTALGDHLAALRQNRGTADGTRMRGSNARECTRKMAYMALGIEPTIAIDTSTLMIFDVGQAVHDRLQAALVKGCNAELEVVASWVPLGFDCSSHADAVYPLADSRACVEIKSMKDFAFGLACKGNPYDERGPGPKPEHLIQAGLSALAPQIDAQWVHIIYINKDSGQMAEWIIHVDQPLAHLTDLGEPTIRQLVETELLRFKAVCEDLDAGFLPERVIPGYGVVDHAPPRPDSKDKPWNCRYCGWRNLCAQLPYGRTALDTTPYFPQAS